MPSLLLLESCNNDRPASRQRAEAEAQQDPRGGKRAVFGPPSDPSPKNPSLQDRRNEERSEALARPGRPDPDEPQDRSRAQTPQAPPRQSPASSPPHGQESASTRQPSLRYQTPGSAVGDPGELSPIAKQPPTEVRSSASVEPVRMLVRRWAETLHKGNLAQHMSLYAETLDRFNG
ncbi:MAG: hypothetical protein H7Y20_03020, partial [Bryobacteraceae bacterium]|nr:hypothetical protein [Bryobacteraceae bacterium]